MKEVQKLPVNRCSGSNCPQSPDKQREKQIKEAFVISARMRKDANATLCRLAERLRCSFPDLLGPLEMQVRRGNLSRCVFVVLVERVESQRKRNVLSLEETIALEKAKSFLKESKQ